MPSRFGRPNNLSKLTFALGIQSSAMLRQVKMLIVALAIGTLVLWATRTPTLPAPTALSFCPLTSSRLHVPTAILHATLSVNATSERTHWVEGPAGGSRNLLPFAYPPRELRFAQKNVDGSKTAGRGRLDTGLDEVEEVGERLCPIFE